MSPWSAFLIPMDIYIDVERTPAIMHLSHPLLPHSQFSLHLDISLFQHQNITLSPGVPQAIVQGRKSWAIASFRVA